MSGAVPRSKAAQPSSNLYLEAKSPAEAELFCLKCISFLLRRLYGRESKLHQRKSLCHNKQWLEHRMAKDMDRM